MKFVIYVVQDGYLDGSMNREYFTLVHCKFHYEQDLGISIKLHLGLIPWPLTLIPCPYPLSFITLYCSFQENLGGGSCCSGG